MYTGISTKHGIRRSFITLIISNLENFLLRDNEVVSFPYDWRESIEDTADELAKEMTKDGIKAQSLHGDKSQGARDKVLLDFKQGKIRALVATDVAARGIDIIDLVYVVNYELPYVAEDYVHRIGRTGRAGKSGFALSLVSPSEEWLLTAIEKVIDTRLLQQWLPGYEPDLTKVNSTKRPENKKKARNKALNKSASKGRRKR